jgi:predicted DNA-binding transcriptional regulator YafY
MKRDFRAPIRKQPIHKLSRPPLERLRELRKLIGAGEYPNCQSLAKKFGVSSKTILRDIDFARDRCGWPMDYDPQKHGYYFTQPLTEFPSIEIAQGELAALLISQKAIQAHAGTVLEKPLRATCAKLMETLGDKISVDWADIDAAISFRSTGLGKTEMKVFNTVSKAVLDSIEISFDYMKLGSRQSEIRRAQPYHVACIENQWYCIAHDLDRQQMRTFALPRMRRVILSKTIFTRPALFSAREYLANSLSIFRGTESAKLYTVRIRFDAWAGRFVQERHWHESQSFKCFPNGDVELRLELANFEEIERMILSWGKHVLGVSPATLARRLHESAKAMLSAFAPKFRKA